VDARRRNGELSAVDYPTLLRTVVDRALRQATAV